MAKCQFRRSGKYSCAAKAAKKFSVGDDSVNLCPTHTKVSKELKFVSGDGEKIQHKAAKKKPVASKKSTTKKSVTSKKKPVVAKKSVTKSTPKKPVAKKSVSSKKK